MDQDPQRAGGVGPVLPGQAAVLFVDQLQLSEALVDLPLERLAGERRREESHPEKDSIISGAR